MKACRKSIFFTNMWQISYNTNFWEMHAISSKILSEKQNVNQWVYCLVNKVSGKNIS